MWNEMNYEMDSYESYPDYEAEQYETGGAFQCPVPLLESYPSTIEGCEKITGSDVTTELVKKIWLEARCYVAQALTRLQYLSALAEAQRKAEWAKDIEQEVTWFGPYTSDNFRKIHRNFQQISEILSSKRFKVVCKPEKKFMASAAPLIHTMKLRSDWLNNGPHTERVQTIIHEAAHIALVVNFLSENKKYGPACAKKLAQQNCFKALRNADNYGYYALRHIPEYKSASAAACSSNYFPKRTCK
jgi:Lysine-specific metallo-endopeptidase